MKLEFRPKITAAVLSVALTAFALGSSAWAKSRCAGVFSLAVSEENPEISKTQALVEDNIFTVDRNMGALDYIYRNKFSDFLENAALRRRKIRWMDWGAGLAVPQVEFGRLNGFLGFPKLEVEMHAVSYKKPKSDYYKDAGKKTKVQALEKAIADGLIKYDEADLNLPFKVKEKFDFATDTVGALDYVKDLTTCLRTQFSALDRGGVFLIHTTNFNSYIKVGRKTLTLGEFLSTIPGLEVETLPVREIGEDASLGRLFEVTLVVTKTRMDVEIPELSLEYWHSDQPPIRIYKVVKPRQRR